MAQRLALRALLVNRLVSWWASAATTAAAAAAATTASSQASLKHVKLFNNSSSSNNSNNIMATAAKEKHIVTIGAGVIGLQTSLALLEAGHRVTIIAKHIPGDQHIEYCSPWAGAQWRSHAAPDDVQQQTWDLASYRYWMELARREERAAISIRKNALVYDSWEHPDLEGVRRGDAASAGNGRGFWFRDEVENFRAVTSPQEEGIALSLTGEGNAEHGGLHKAMAAAVVYNTPFVDVPKYLTYLKARILEFDGRGRVVKIEDGLPSSGGLAKLIGSTLDIMEMGGLVNDKSEISAVIHATGLGAREIIGDAEKDKMKPVRGQILVVKGVANLGFTRQGTTPEALNGEEGYISYVLPRPVSGSTVIGGCKEPGRWNAEAEEERSRSIKERAALLCPELLTKDGDFEVLGAQVGLRPARAGGARVELETVKLSDGKTCPVIHAYGNGGAGFQNSVGVGDHVLKIVQESV